MKLQEDDRCNKINCLQTPYNQERLVVEEKVYKENGWLNTDEIRAAVKAYRLFKDNVDIDEVVENFEMFSGGDSDS